jgi:hypothetical protein
MPRMQTFGTSMREDKTGRTISATCVLDVPPTDYSNIIEIHLRETGDRVQLEKLDGIWRLTTTLSDVEQVEKQVKHERKA